ncbi:hypothetical protein GCM10010387_61670 [Streptomyces inusitatus]|uniref:Uncharacterized protein n=1 Tax=Streptomyces inusitatus TaxID=68221 RepID=A0A918QQE1_9ACTN|nr:hypothetical protein [Streptomyces inusitatus]GGZ59587.1 hypothetical protein GCM10010387_61670 [Streptomyces inusitatus]
MLIGLPIDHFRGRTNEETVISAIRKSLTAAAVVTLVVTGAAACGTVENLSAGQKLDRAFEKLGKEKSISLELDLDADAQTLTALGAESSGPGEKMPKEVAEAFSGGKISLSVESKKPLADSGEKDLTGMAMKFSTPEGDAAEYRLVGDHVYFRLDAKVVAGLMGQPAPAEDELPESAGPLKSLLSGDWVKFSAKEARQAAEEMSKGLDEAGAEPSAEPSLDAATQKKVVDALSKAIARETEFSTAEGKDGTERITATASLRSLVTELIDTLRPLVKDLPQGADLLPAAKDLKELPNSKAKADFTLKNGSLNEVSVDLAALAEKKSAGKIALVLRLGGGDKPEAPAGASEVTMDELIEGFFGGPPEKMFSDEELPPEMRG